MNTVTASPDSPLLRVEHLRTVFPLRSGGEAAAVADVSFTLSRGETLGLVGESGSGKSVTALSLIRLIQPPGRVVSGAIHFDGRDLMTLDEPALRSIRGRRIGFVFQEPMVALNPVYTIGQQIAETLAVHGLARGAAARTKAVEWLEAARVPKARERANAYPHQLSGGLRQRAMIALALCAEPSLVIADEPTSALDVSVQQQVLALLAELQQRYGMSYVFISHDLAVVRAMAHRVLVMKDGDVIEEGEAQALFDAPRQAYTQALLAAAHLV